MTYAAPGCHRLVIKMNRAAIAIAYIWRTQADLP
jgi:hypothetical protein